jgi:hypothetical protein
VGGEGVGVEGVGVCALSVLRWAFEKGKGNGRKEQCWRVLVHAIQITCTTLH